MQTVELFNLLFHPECYALVKKAALYTLRVCLSKGDVCIQGSRDVNLLASEFPLVTDIFDRDCKKGLKIMYEWFWKSPQ